MWTNSRWFCCCLWYVDAFKSYHIWNCLFVYPYSVSMMTSISTYKTLSTVYWTYKVRTQSRSIIWIIRWGHFWAIAHWRHWCKNHRRIATTIITMCRQHSHHIQINIHHSWADYRPSAINQTNLEHLIWIVSWGTNVHHTLCLAFLLLFHILSFTVCEHGKESERESQKWRGGEGRSKWRIIRAPCEMSLV